MGIYGRIASELINNNNIVEIYLSESTIILYDKKKKGEIELYVRDGSEKTAGGTIPKSKDENKSQHAASVKLKSPKQITGSAGIPIEIHSNKVNWDESKFSKLKEISEQDKKAVINFLKDNISELDKLYYATKADEKEELWKQIIDNSIDDIKDIKVTNDSNSNIKKYFDDKKKGTDK